MSSPASSPSDDGPGPGSESPKLPEVPPKRGSPVTLALTLGLLALLVWALAPRRIRVKPSPLDAAASFCAPSKAEFLPSNLTEVPGVPVQGLPDRVKNRILLRLNMEPCTCGCAQSLASCRAGNPQCPVSPQAVDTIVKEEPGNAGPGDSRTPVRAR